MSPTIVDVRYNYWGNTQYLIEPVDRIKKDSCAPIRTLPYLKDRRFDSELSNGTYYDPLVSNIVVNDIGNFPYGIIVNNTSFTALPKSRITVLVCGMTLVGNYDLQLNRNVMNPVTLQSTSDVASSYPMITFAETLKNISFFNVEIYAEASI